jgi:hypothetical protein
VEDLFHPVRHQRRNDALLGVFSFSHILTLGPLR